MPGFATTPDTFIVIGENIHTSRVVSLKGRRVKTLDGGQEGIEYREAAGDLRYLIVPPHFRETQAYQGGQLKHVMFAVWKGVHGGADDQREADEYVAYEARRQIGAGAHFLDLNVDEVSPDLEEQKRSMRWLVKAVEKHSSLPLSIDSSNVEIIAAGLAECAGKAGRPMLNSLALERVDALDLVKKFNTHVVVTAASIDGMPSDDEERVDNVAALLEKVLARDVPAPDIHVDALVFPISVAANYGRHYLDAIHTIRQKYGPEIHITGGLSNVSFGLPNRKLINESFIYLAVQHGADCGIIDPVSTKVSKVFELDTRAEPVKIAMAMLLGEDEYCANYLRAYRAGKLG
ncbi:MAG: dihydropteroate synthase [Chloroflexi bacterium]|nr:dihydropteroate synthase [Chloroflexota bacterium]